MSFSKGNFCYHFWYESSGKNYFVCKLWMWFSSLLIYIYIFCYGRPVWRQYTSNNEIWTKLNKRRSKVTPFKVSVLSPDPLWWTSLPTFLLPIVIASHLVLIVILLPFDKALSPPRTIVYGFYTRYCNDTNY